MNQIGTVIVIIILCALVAGIIFSIISDHKKGKHLCGGDCSKCHGCH